MDTTAALLENLLCIRYLNGKLNAITDGSQKQDSYKKEKPLFYLQQQIGPIDNPLARMLRH